MNVKEKKNIKEIEWEWETNRFEEFVDVDDNDDGDCFCEGQMTRLEQDFEEAFLWCVQDDGLSVKRFVFALAGKHHGHWADIEEKTNTAKNGWKFCSALQVHAEWAVLTSLLSAVNLNSASQIVRT